MVSLMIKQGNVMGTLFLLLAKSYALNEDKDREYYDCIGSYCHTPEFLSMEKNIQHGSINVCRHTYSVSYISYRIAKKRGLNYRSAAKGALLHDLFYYDWHEKDPSHRLHGYYHPGFALKNARELSLKVGDTLSQMEENIIYRHMFPLTVIPPKYRESLLVCAVDKYVSTMEIMICKFPGLKKSFIKNIEMFKSDPDLHNRGEKLEIQSD